MTSTPRPEELDPSAPWPPRLRVKVVEEREGWNPIFTEYGKRFTTCTECGRLLREEHGPACSDHFEPTS